MNGPGGAEKVFQKYRDAFHGSCEVTAVCEARKGFGPSWWRAMAFARMADKVIAANPGALSISLQRGPRAQIFRAGDGVHRRYLQLMNSFSLNPWHIVAPMLDEKSFGAAKVIIANSKMVAEDIRRFYPSEARKVRVVYNGFDPKKFFVSPELRREFRRRLGLPEEGALFLFMGNGWKRKGLKQAMEIVRRCAKLKPKLVVVGKGKQSQLPRDIIFRGYVNNMPDYYRACDAFILPTLYDPFSSSVLEALACGIPVVTTRQNGASEVVREGESGFLMDVQNKDIREAAAWLENAEKLPAEKIAETVSAYTVEHEIGAIRKIFEEVEK